MTTTDTTTAIDPATAERLARLQARRQRSATEPIADTAAVAAPTTPAPDAPTGALPPSGRHSRRRSPASSAKILTVGATATATLGLIALYGLAEQRSTDAAGNDQPVDTTAGSSTTPAPTAEFAIPAAAPTTPAPPQVVVIVVDGRTGEVVSGGNQSTNDPAVAAAVDAAVDATVSTTAGGVTTPAMPDPSTSARPAPVAPAAVPAPDVVELAVPAPPSAAPAPAPAPQASSDGS